MEAAKEAEERAARERAVQPLEVRVRRFREMLVEMQVSAFSTWEKELHKIVFDPRYLLLASKERKQTFEAYVKERAEEERREKKSKLKEKKEKFVELMDEAGLNSKSSFGDFAAKYSKDDRFKGIEKSRDREAMFQDYLVDLRKREKEDKHREKEKVKVDFFNMLKEQKSINRYTHWTDVKRKVDSDPRYKAVESSSNERTGLENSYANLMRFPLSKKIINGDPRFEKISSDRKKESEYCMWVEVKKSQAKDAFKELLKETKLISNRTKATLEENENHISDIMEALEKDKRFIALDAFEDERNALIEDYIDSLDKRRTPTPVSISSKDSGRR
ncbi:unnamed protein product [Heterobilharzia americana]|nr:unnamed protein product [Heterobilharzia americana]